MNQKKLIAGYFFVILSAFIFGLMPLMAKLIYKEGTNPQSLVFLRNIISIPVLLLLSVATKKPIKINAAAIPYISVIALMGCCITPLLLFHSYNHIPSGTATVFHFIYPPVVVLGEYIFLKNKFSLSNLLSVFLCVIGIVLFYNPDTTINIKGSLYALVSGVTYAIYVMCLSGFKYKEISGFTFSLYIAISASAVMLLVCIFTDQLKFPQSIFGWVLTFLFSISLNVGAVVLFQKGTFLIGGGRASVLSTIEPVTSILAGVVIFNEKISAFTVIGTLLVITASILIALSDRTKRLQHTPAAGTEG
ncbi:MAG: DMT family transporter [Clostridia bacterium]|nr:DMT family transporter [Clostridia bacterium]